MNFIDAHQRNFSVILIEVFNEEALWGNEEHLYLLFSDSLQYSLFCCRWLL